MKQGLFCLGVAALLALPATAGVLYDTGGFEAYSLGTLPGQDGWISDTVDLDPNDAFIFSDPQIINDPTGGGMGQVAMFDAPDGVASQGWTGADHDAGPNTQPIVTMEWDQWRADTGDNVWLADDLSFSGWYAIEWDLSGGAYPQFFDGTAVALTPGVWQHVTYTFDFLANTVTVDVDGTSSTVAKGGYTNINGIDFEVEGTATAGDGPLYIDNVVISEVPEPASLLLLGLGGLALLRRR